MEWASNDARTITQRRPSSGVQRHETWSIVSGVRRPSKKCTTIGCRSNAVKDAQCAQHHVPFRLGQHLTREQRKQRYTPQYAKQRQRVLHRDGRACIICGSSQQLEVHHINGDSDHVSNLVTLCRTHHRAAEREQHIKQSIIIYMEGLGNG